MIASGDVEPVQRAGRGDQQRVMVDPTCGADIGIELPMLAFRVQTVAKDIAPEKLFAFRVPERAFAQLTLGVVKDHLVASS